MARIVKRTWQEPCKHSIGGEGEDKLCWCDAGGKRRACADAFPGVRSY